MNLIRAFFLSHRRMAALLIAAALCMKALIPGGYMLGGETRMITVQICADTLGHAITKQIDVGQKGHAPNPQKSSTPCAYTALGHAAMGGADTVLLALALGFILALGFAPQMVPAPRRVAYLRPPLRGPPARG